MTFADRIPMYGSVAVVGLAKNAGKTETLNYVLGRLAGHNSSLALTSIGIDGESVDQVTRTRKPEITVGRDTVFVTSEAHYRQRRLLADILAVSERHTSLGRLVTARVRTSGKVILSGPATTAELRTLIRRMKERGRITIVDGALSRLSLSSPAVTDAMVLATGAAVSRTVDGVVNRTAYVAELIALPRVGNSMVTVLKRIEKGVWSIDNDGRLHDLGLRSALGPVARKDTLFTYGRTLFTPGAVGDRFIDTLTAASSVAAPVTLIVSDFTRIFAAADVYRRFLRRGGTIRVLRRSRLLAVTVNPLSPEGYRLDSSLLQDRLRSRLRTIAGLEDTEVCDVVNSKP